MDTVERDAEQIRQLGRPAGSPVPDRATEADGSPESDRSPGVSRTAARRNGGVQPAHPSGQTPPHAVSPAEAIAQAELSRSPNDLPAILPKQRWLERLAPLAPYAAISAGAVLGANARYLVGLWAVAQWGAGFPWGTLLVNVSGSLLLGFYLTLATERFAGRATTRLFVTTGFCGAYTTFSTFSYETVALLQRGAVLAALAYVLGSLAMGLLAAGAGMLAARAL